MGYADSNGYFNADSDRPLAWKFRDYFVRSLNADKRLDQFIREQIAGDELVKYFAGSDLTPEMIDPLIATHFWRNAPDGSGERVLVDARAGYDKPEPAYPVWSRDSRTIYYKAYDRDRHSSIWSVPITGEPARLLVRFDDPSRRSLRREFATDGQRFYFTIARDESDLWAMEILTK